MRDEVNEPASVLFSSLFFEFFLKASFTIYHLPPSLFLPPPVGLQWHPPSESVTWPWEAAAGSTVTL